MKKSKMTPKEWAALYSMRFNRDQIHAMWTEGELKFTNAMDRDLGIGLKGSARHGNQAHIRIQGTSYVPSVAILCYLLHDKDCQHRADWRAQKALGIYDLLKKGK
jgi:hypothetical protein